MRYHNGVRRSAPVAIAAAAVLVVGVAVPAAGASTTGAPVAANPAITEPGAAASGAAQVEAPVPELDWGECGEGLEQFECTIAEVPTDYDEPEGASTSIAMTRMPATDPQGRIGSLFLNFGGPGGPGVESLQMMGDDLFTEEVRAQFDLIGFDPRGVGDSDPVTCFPDADTEFEFLSSMQTFPVGHREEIRYIAQNATLGASCTVVSGDRISTSSTANVARDMDVLRQAVGDEELNYVGYSYGTFLGATYGALFPDRIRTMVLDGTVEPATYVGAGDDRVLGRRTGQHVAAAEAYQQFLQLCEQAGSQQCALAGLGDPEQVVEDLFDQLADEPVELDLGDGSTMEFGYDEAVATIFQALYSPTQWSDLAASLAALIEPAEEDQAFSAQSGVEEIRDFLREIDFFEEYVSIGGSLASVCMDAEHPAGLRDYPAQSALAEEEAEHFGAARAWLSIPCETMGGTDQDAYTGPWEQSTDAPVLVIGTQYDPGTPYEFTEPYADLWQDARMLTVEGYGHTTMMAPSACANAAIEDYLIDLEATDGATCTQDVAPFTPAAQDEQPELTPAAIG